MHAWLSSHCCCCSWGQRQQGGLAQLLWHSCSLARKGVPGRGGGSALGQGLPWPLGAKPTEEMLPVGKNPFLDSSFFGEILMVPMFCLKIRTKQNISKSPHTMRAVLCFCWNAEPLPFPFWKSGPPSSFQCPLLQPQYTEVCNRPPVNTSTMHILKHWRSFL